MDPNASWFKFSTDYWENVEASNEGMLGGYGSLSSLDEKDTLEFISKNIAPSFRQLSLDCGAGIGRVSKNVLLKLFDRVSLIESSEKFINYAKDTLPTGRVFYLHNTTIQNMSPKPDEVGKYDLVWFQWVLCYADDESLVKILNISKRFVHKNGFIGVKENILSNGQKNYDYSDHSMVRSDDEFKEIFKMAGLQIIAIAKQRNFPSTLYTVRMYLLQSEPRS